MLEDLLDEFDVFLVVGVGLDFGLPWDSSVAGVMAWIAAEFVFRFDH